MKKDPLVLTLLILIVGVIAQTACSSGSTANGNKPVATANSSTANSKAANSNSSNTNSAATAANQNKATSPTTTGNVGTIEVASTPPGARVLLVATEEDSAGEPQPKGLTPAMIGGLKPGKYTVDVEMPGYKFFQKEVEVKAGATVKVNAALRKK